MRRTRVWIGAAHPFLVDVLLGAVVLVGITLAVGTRGFFFIDEAALLGQVELRREGQWTTPRPLPELDADGELVPMARSYVTADEFAPFAKHPVHVELATVLDRIGGRTGVRLLSSAGTLVAAASAWLLARRSSLGAARAAFWVTLLVSPLVFDAQLLVAHALAAALAGATFVAIDRLGGWRRVLVAVVLIALGSLVRSEFVLLGLALGAVLGMRGVRRRCAADIAVAVGAIAAALGAYVIEPILVRRVAGGSAEVMRTTSAVSTGLGDAAEAGRRALFGTLLGVHGRTSTILVFLVLVTVVGATAWLRRRPDDPGPAVALGAAAVGLAAAWVAFPTIASGLLLAFPLQAALLWSPTARARRLPSWTMTAPLLFAGAVLLLQYQEVGGLEWGWRYVALALPPMCAWIAVALHRTWQEQARAGRVAVGLVVAASLLVAVGGLREQRRYLSNTAAFESAVQPLLDEPADWFVSADASFGRFAYELSLGREVLTFPDDRAEEVVDELAARGAERLVLVWRDEAPDLDLVPYVPAGAVTDIAGGYRWQRYERSSE